MKFSKLQATGNGFILVDTFTQTLSLEEREPGEGEIEYRCKQGNPSPPIKTSSGIKEGIACVSANKVKRVEVNMGQPQFQPEQIPVMVKVDIMLMEWALTLSWDRVGEKLLSSPVEEVFTGAWLRGNN
jgi:diaminopimelate epimerase